MEPRYIYAIRRSGRFSIFPPRVLHSDTMSSDKNLQERTPASIKKNGSFLASKLKTGVWKYLAITWLLLLIVLIYVAKHPCSQSSAFSIAKMTRYRWNDLNSPTNINHLVFGISGSSNTWSHKKSYTETWWRPNETRGYLFLDHSPIQHLPWPPSWPPFRISEDNSKYNDYNKHKMPLAIRMARVIEETFNAERKGVRWYVMADDDTVLFIDNLVEILSKYDHRKYFYIGINSESVICNALNSFDMAYSGAGYALSYPLAKAVAKNMDLCIKRYPTLYGSDHILQSCIADIGVSLTREKGFHQIDLHGDISGLLSAHPNSPLLSLHHLDAIDPIFPSKNRPESVKHLMKAAKIDHSRLLQQSVCNQNHKNWTFSVSWGYTVQIYEQIIPPSILHKPIARFKEWMKGASTPFMLNARNFAANDPCQVPHVLYLDGVEESSGDDHIVTRYRRASSRQLPACSFSGNHSAESISKIYVFSPREKFLGGDGNKRECCDVVQPVGMDSLAIKLRRCLDDEIIV